MTAAQFETLDAEEVEGLLRDRFETLTSRGCPPASAAVIASHIEIEVHDAIDLLQRGCPAEAVVPLLS